MNRRKSENINKRKKNPDFDFFYIISYNFKAHCSTRTQNKKKSFTFSSSFHSNQLILSQLPFHSIAHEFDKGIHITSTKPTAHSFDFLIHTGVKKYFPFQGKDRKKSEAGW